MHTADRVKQTALSDLRQYLGQRKTDKDDKYKLKPEPYRGNGGDQRPYVSPARNSPQISRCIINITAHKQRRDKLDD